MWEIVKNYRASFEKRTVLNSSLTALMNFAWSAVKFVLGIYLQSYLLCMIALFTFLVGFIKRGCVNGINHYIAGADELKKYGDGGKLIIIAGVIYLLYMVGTLIFPQNISYNLIPAIAIAGFAFFSVAMSVVGIVKTRGKSKMLKEIKLLAFSTSLTDIALTQVAILSFASEQDLSFYNSAFGIAIGVVIIAIGTYIRIDGHKNHGGI